MEKFKDLIAQPINLLLRRIKGLLCRIAWISAQDQRSQALR